MGGRAPQTTTTTTNSNSNSNRGRTVISINELLNWEFQYFNSIQFNSFANYLSFSASCCLCLFEATPQLVKLLYNQSTNRIILQWDREKWRAHTETWKRVNWTPRIYQFFSILHHIAQSSAELTTMETCWTKEQVPIWTEKHHCQSVGGRQWKDSVR